MIYVINLARRPDRWKLWEINAKKWNIGPYERWEAVDGKQLILTPELKSLFRNINYYFDFRKPAAACALSHIQIWRHIIKQGLQRTIIFEDDAIFFSKPFEIPELPEGWDIFYFGGIIDPNFEMPGIKIQENIVLPKLPKNITFICAYCYMISLEGAKKLVNRIEKKGMQDPLDIFMVGSFEELNVYCYSPFTVYASATDSDIRPSDTNILPAD